MSAHPGPRLRGGLTFRLVVKDPATGRTHELEDIEWAVARQMDGTRTIDDLLACAKESHPPATREQIEAFIARVASEGLLEEASPADRVPPPLVLDMAPVPSSSWDSEFDSSDLLDASSTEVAGVPSVDSTWQEPSVTQGSVAPSPSTLPRLRPNLQFLQGANGLVRVTDPSTGKSFEVYEVEAALAKKMDGATTLEQLAAWMKVRPAAIASVARDWAAYGFVDWAGARKAPDPTREVREVREVREIVERVSQSLEDEQPPTVEAQAPLAAHAPPAHPVHPPPQIHHAPLSAPPPPPETPERAPPQEKPILVERHQPQRPGTKSIDIIWRFRYPAAAALLLVAAALIQWPLIIVLPCSLLPAQRASVRAETDGVIRALQVKEGDSIKKGDLVAVLDDDEFKRTLAAIDAESAALVAELERLKIGARPEGIARARALVQTRQAELAAAVANQKRTRSPPAKRAEADRRLEAAKKAFGEAQALMALLSAGRLPDALREKETALKKLSADRAQYEYASKHVRILSPIDGKVSKVLSQDDKNKAVQIGTEIAEIVDFSRARVDIEVPGADLDAVKEGLELEVRAAKLPGRTFNVKLQTIGLAEAKGEGRSARAVAYVDNADLALHEEQTGTAEIRAGDRSLLKLATRALLRMIGR